MKILCRLGIHSWTEWVSWKYISPKKSWQYRSCKRCGKKQYKE